MHEYGDREKIELAIGQQCIRGSMYGRSQQSVLRTLIAPVEETQVCLPASCLPFVGVLWPVEHGELQMELGISSQLAATPPVNRLNTS